MKHAFGLILVCLTTILLAQNPKKSDKTYRKAVKMIAQNRPEKEVFPVLLKAIQEDSANYFAWNMAGILSSDKNQYATALYYFGKAISVSPEITAAYDNRANTLTDSGLTDAALLDLNKSLSLDPKSVLTYCNRGRVFFIREQYDAAYNDFSKAFSLDPTNVIANVNLGALFFQRGDTIQAIQRSKRAIELNPERADSYFALGTIYFSIYDGQKAVDMFSKAEKLGYKDFDLYQYLASCYSVLGEYALSIPYFDKCISLNPDLSDSYFGRGTSYGLLHEYEKAEADLSKAIELDPKGIGAFTNRALFVYAETGRYLEALADFNRVMTLRPADESKAFELNNSGYVYYKMGQYDKALQFVNESLVDNPTNGYAYRNLALIYIALNKKTEACSAANKAIELDFVKKWGNEILDIQKQACN